MPYCTQADIEKSLPLIEIIQLTDDSDLGVVGSAVLTAIISRADALIDSYVSKVKSVPLSPVPVLITNLSVAISIWYLHERRNRDNEVRRRSFEDALKSLESIAEKDTTLDDGSTAASASENSVQFESPVKNFTDENMGQF